MENMANPQIFNTFASLGVRYGDKYNVSDDCLSILEEILRKLALEDQTLRTFRRAIGFGQNIRKDLIPLLIYVKDDTEICDATKIIDTTIKILVNLTIPVECLLSIDAVSCTDVGRHTIFELNKLLITSKEAFTDSRSTKAVVDHIKHVVEQDYNMDDQQCDSINNCLLLLRNLLYIPEIKTSISNCPLANTSMQNVIIWNLFTQHIDKIVIHLVTCPQKKYWSVSTVQLISLMYKDQHVGILQKLLNLWLEASLSESSDDNESNTSPPDQNRGDSSAGIQSSDPTSDSSDNGGSMKSNVRNKNIQGDNNRHTNHLTEVMRTAQNRSNKVIVEMKRAKSTETETSSSSGVSSLAQSSKGSSHPEIHIITDIHNNQGKTVIAAGLSSQSEVSDCGYVTQMENQETVSTSSNDDDRPSKKPVYQKPHTFQKSRINALKSRPIVILDKKELRRKKLVKRSKTNLINMKGLIHHKPTDEDITVILKEFTVDFLLKGYGNIVHDLYEQLLEDIPLPIDTSHFFWLVTYFLKFATQLELDLEHISQVLSFEIISYLIFQGVSLYEELEVTCKIPNYDLKPCLRRLHLVVTAIREFLQAFDIYNKMPHLCAEERALLKNLQEKMVQTEELKNLFLILLRQFNSNLQSKQYLQDLIVTNHNYFVFLENAVEKNANSSSNIVEQLRQYATREIMRNYGILLDSFKENGEFVNNCIFTLMHHIGGDLEHISTLFQPSILKTFSLIWETDYQICDDWSDLIEFVIHKFVNTLKVNQQDRYDSSITPVFRKEQLPDVLQTTDNDVWCHGEETNSHIQDQYNTIGYIIKKYGEIGNTAMTQHAIINELLRQAIITQDQYDDFMKPQEAMRDSISMDYSAILAPDLLINSDINGLKNFLIKDNKGKHLKWLQKITLEACFVKLALSNKEVLSNNTLITEPSIYYNALLHLPIPVIPWTTEQCKTLSCQPFILLLHKLGFYLPVDTGKVFVRIPNFWTADYLFSIAEQLGPIDTGILKFDVEVLTKLEKCDNVRDGCEITKNIQNLNKFTLTSDLRQTPSILRYTPTPNMEWIETILRDKDSPMLDSTFHTPSDLELSITIPEIEALPCNFTPPKLAIVDRSLRETFVEKRANMLNLQSDDLLIDLDHISNCETLSVASDLTRMCVSEEDDKDVYMKDLQEL